MSPKAIATASFMILVSSSLHAADAEKTNDIIATKDISSISIARNYRQLTINANAKHYLVTFEKPCSALRRSDVSVANQSAEQLSAGTELKVGASSCIIKAIARDIDSPIVATANDVNDPRQLLAGPIEFRQRR